MPGAHLRLVGMSFPERLASLETTAEAHAARIHSVAADQQEHGESIAKLTAGFERLVKLAEKSEEHGEAIATLVGNVASCDEKISTVITNQNRSMTGALSDLGKDEVNIYGLGPMKMRALWSLVLLAVIVIVALGIKDQVGAAVVRMIPGDGADAPAPAPEDADQN